MNDPDVDRAEAIHQISGRGYQHRHSLYFRSCSNWLSAIRELKLCHFKSVIELLRDTAASRRRKRSPRPSESFRRSDGSHMVLSYWDMAAALVTNGDQPRALQ